MKNFKITFFALLMFFSIANLSTSFSYQNDNSSIAIDSSNYFTNPIGKGADPWVIKDNGFYYVCQSGLNKAGENVITIKKSSSLIKMGKREEVWKAPKNQWNSTNVWAPELHHIGNHWYIYYAAGKSGPPYAFQRSGVLESVSDDAQGEYVDKGMLKTGTDENDFSGTYWAIDLTVSDIRGQLYAIWSGWENNQKSDKTKQYLYIAKMNSPTLISSERVKISEPSEGWEIGGPLNLNEGPQLLIHSKDVFIIYSARESWTPQYRLGQLRLKTNADPMKAESWIKSGPVFMGNPEVYGVGHASFTKSPDDKEWWIFYHSKIDKTPGWKRDLRLQQFYWDKAGNPIFGNPLPAGTKIKKPSGEI
ncbi:glycoside hydrolase [Pedobacter psychrophilus]|uniref:Glycoside hydrolase n=1 Tax=Pedobacter psychrophilus TaxID=1826909 RepID=A0A179DH94_9SPHI|nr:glycoside hydrolase family 43 protein [Pedobacter psychrophilus]OAQ40328.1 glycoside hydrolase [Pedobacter psychrophilus]